jgi:hypothetical protein
MDLILLGMETIPLPLVASEIAEEGGAKKKKLGF